MWGELVSFSEQQLIDCSGNYGNKGCTGGTVQNAFDYVHHTGGICAENSYSYLGYVRSGLKIIIIFVERAVYNGGFIMFNLNFIL